MSGLLTFFTVLMTHESLVTEQRLLNHYKAMKSLEPFGVMVHLACAYVVLVLSWIRCLTMTAKWIRFALSRTPIKTCWARLAVEWIASDRLDAQELRRRSQIVRRQASLSRDTNARECLKRAASLVESAANAKAKLGERYTMPLSRQFIDK